MIALQAEVLELKANPNRAAEGTVIEARLDRGRGPVATVLVQRGTLRPGDIVVAGSEWGRVRALMSDTGHSVVAAGPSMPVEILGFNGTPEASDRLAAVETEARAREIADYRARQKRDMLAARQTGMRGSLEQMMSQLKTTGRKEFPLVIKGDVQGSIEAIVGALEKLSTDEVAARMIYSGAGGITESDVTLAEASGAALIGFNVRAHKEAREAAEQAGIEIRYYDIIYNLVDDVKKAMSGLLAPTLRETMLGNAVDPRSLQGLEGRQRRRLPRHRRHRRARRQCPADPRQCRRPSGQAVATQALQGRRARGRRRPGMRHGVRELPGHEGRRRHRVLPGGERAADAVSSNSAIRIANSVPGKSCEAPFGVTRQSMQQRRS